MSQDAEKPKLVPEQAAKGGPGEIQTAWRILAGGAPVAATALVDIAENGRSELARVQASTAILDRVGLGTPKEIHHRVVPTDAEEHGHTQQLSPAEVIRARLAKLKGPTQALVQGTDLDQVLSGAGLTPQAQQDPEPVDAEIVDDEEDQWPL